MAEIITYVQSKSSAPPPFSPTDIAGLQLWLKADAGVTLNGSTVSQWDNQAPTGSSYDAVQINAVNQPTYVINALNGKPVLRFNNGQYLQGNIVQTSYNISIFCVAKISSYDNNDRIYVLKENGLFDWISGPILYLNSGIVGYYAKSHHVCNAANSINNDFRTYEYIDVDSGITAKSYLNGDYVQSGIYENMYKSDSYTIGAGDDGVVRYFFSGDFVEFIVYYGVALSDTQRQQVEQYLRTKYAHY